MRGRGIGLTGAAFVALIAGNPALAQEGGGLLLTLGITERLETSENAQLANPSSGRLTASTTSLSFGLSSETQTQVLRLGLSGGLRFEDGASAAAADQFDNPRLDAFYSLTGANSLLVLQANADRSTLSQAAPTVDDPDPSGSGSRLRHSASATLDLGTSGPLGLTLDAAHSGSEFEGSNEADSSTLSYSATGHLRFASGAQARLGVSRSDYAEETALDLRRETTGITLGWTQPLTAALTLQASAGQQRVDTLLLGFLVDRTEGLSGDFGLSMEMANGSAGLSLSQAIEPGATRQTLRADRVFDLGNQNIALTLGATRQEGAAAEMIGGLTWRYDAPGGSVSLGVNRSIASGGLDSEVATDRVALGLSREIGQSDRLSLEMSATRIDNSSANLVERVDLTASYNRDLGEDWQVSLGANMTRREEETAATVTSRTIFLSVTRNFDW